MFPQTPKADAAKITATITTTTLITCLIFPSSGAYVFNAHKPKPRAHKIITKVSNGIVDSFVEDDNSSELYNALCPQLIMKIKKHCHVCGIKAIRIDQFDAYACKQCCIWLEKQCSDINCDYCGNRPQQPIGVDWNHPNNT